MTESQEKRIDFRARFDYTGIATERSDNIHPFGLHALNTLFDLEKDLGGKELRQAMEERALAQAELLGSYANPERCCFIAPSMQLRSIRIAPVCVGQIRRHGMH